MPSPSPPSAAACIFCEIAAHRAPGYVLYEDADTIAFLDLYPFTRGHFLVVPRRHGARLADLDEADRIALMHTVDRMCRRVGRLAPDYNLALNAGAAAGQIVFHVHFHVIPRYGEANPFHPRPRVALDPEDAGRVVATLAAP